MELRPIQVALLAGRSTSRRATASPSPLSFPLALSLYRCFSSTRPSLSEAEATAPAPVPSMQEWNEQQQQEQPEQQQPRTWGSPASNNGPGTSFGISSLLRPNNSTQTPSPPEPPSEDSRRAPWSEPSSPILRRAQASRAATNDGSRPGILETLKDLNLLAPSSEDLMGITGQSTESAADIKYRLRPSVGRTVNLDRTVDLARGLSILNTRVRNNKVSQDFAKQRFHERPGLKRKRLRRERWRARFKDGFKANCSRVQELARQGW